MEKNILRYREFIMKKIISQILLLSFTFQSYGTTLEDFAGCPKGSMLDKSFVDQWNAKAEKAVKLANGELIGDADSAYNEIKLCLKGLKQRSPCHTSIEKILQKYVNDKYADDAFDEIPSSDKKQLDPDYKGFDSPRSERYKALASDVIDIDKSVTKLNQELFFNHEFLDDLLDPNKFEQAVENKRKEVAEKYKNIEGEKPTLALTDSPHFNGNGRSRSHIPNVGRLLIALPPNEKGCRKFMTIHVPSKEHKTKTDGSFVNEINPKNGRHLVKSKKGDWIQGWARWNEDRERQERIMAVLDFCEDNTLVEGGQQIYASKFKIRENEKKTNFDLATTKPDGSPIEMQDCMACHRGLLPLNGDHNGVGWREKYGEENAKEIDKVNNLYNNDPGFANARWAVPAPTKIGGKTPSQDTYVDVFRRQKNNFPVGHVDNEELFNGDINRCFKDQEHFKGNSTGTVKNLVKQSMNCTSCHDGVNKPEIHFTPEYFLRDGLNPAGTFQEHILKNYVTGHGLDDKHLMPGKITDPAIRGKEKEFRELLFKCIKQNYTRMNGDPRMPRRATNPRADQVFDKAYLDANKCEQEEVPDEGYCPADFEIHDIDDFEPVSKALGTNVQAKEIKGIWYTTYIKKNADEPFLYHLKDGENSFFGLSHSTLDCSLGCKQSNFNMSFDKDGNFTAVTSKHNTANNDEVFKWNPESKGLAESDHSVPKDIPLSKEELEEVSGDIKKLLDTKNDKFFLQLGKLMNDIHNEDNPIPFDAIFKDQMINDYQQGGQIDATTGATKIRDKVLDNYPALKGLQSPDKLRGGMGTYMNLVFTAWEAQKAAKNSLKK